MYYRLFILDHRDNLVTGLDLQSPGDDEALDWASFVLGPGRVGELWCGTRLVGRATPAHDLAGGIELRCLVGRPARDEAQAVFMFG